MNEKKYELRGLQSKDMFSMFAILNKIGFAEVKTALDNDSVKKAMMKTGKKAIDFSSVGLTIMLEVIGIIMGHLPECEKEIYAFLSALSGLETKKIQELPMEVFAEMIVDVIQKDEFKGFFKVVSKLFA